MQMCKRKKLISGGTAIDPANGINAKMDILIEDGKISAIDKPGQFAGVVVDETIDVAGKIVTPGLIDIHVHLREPGQEWKETIATGAKAAVAGGFTAVCCMPNTVPAIDNASVVELVLDRAKQANLCRVYPIGAITVKRQGEAMAPFLEMREAGCVAFSDDGAPVMNSQIMRKALEYNTMLGCVLTVHEEDLHLSEGFVMNESEMSIKLGLRGMPEAAENVMIARDIELARLTKGRVHFCHVSTARGIQLIRRAKEDGIPVTAEVTPHNIVCDDSWLFDYNTNCKMSMPLRSKEDVEILTEALNQGVIDCVATDHAPHELDSKRVEFDKASFGVIGLQTAVPLLLQRVREGKLSLTRAIESLGSSAAKCLNIETNALVVGKVADITVIDLDLKMKFSEDKIFSKSKNSMFLGHELQGWAVKTIVAGRQVFDISEEGK
jgi:dihydroorotase